MVIVQHSPKDVVIFVSEDWLSWTKGWDFWPKTKVETNRLRSKVETNYPN